MTPAPAAPVGLTRFVLPAPPFSAADADTRLANTRIQDPIDIFEAYWDARNAVRVCLKTMRKVKDALGSIKYAIRQIANERVRPHSISLFDRCLSDL
jgi:hypothetical protein